MSEQANAAKRAEGLRACADGIDKYPDKEFALKCMRHAADRMEELETELAAAREQLKKTRKHLKDANRGAEINAHALRINADKLAFVTLERDAWKAEALSVISNTYDPKNGQCVDGYSPVFHARKALAAVKGGCDES